MKKKKQNVTGLILEDLNKGFPPTIYVATGGGWTSATYSESRVGTLRERELLGLGRVYPTVWETLGDKYTFRLPLEFLR